MNTLYGHKKFKILVKNMIQISHKKELENLLTKHELELFSRLKELIQKLNKISNLTRLIDGNDYWVSQVYDSLWPFFKDSNQLFYDYEEYYGQGIIRTITRWKSLSETLFRTT